MRLQLAPRLRGIDDRVAWPTEAEQVRHELPVDGQWHAVTRGRTQRALVVEFVHMHQTRKVVEQPFRVRGRPQSHRTGHRRLHMRPSYHGQSDVLFAEGDQCLRHGRGFTGRSEEVFPRV